jgi:hypothetical protein
MQDSSPIWAPYEAFYIQSMLFHTRQACISIERTVELINHISIDLTAGVDTEFDCSLALDDVQNILFRAAAVSRYLWPARKPYQNRGATLRSALCVRDDSPLRNRDLRDAAEHFDERLDNYLKEGIVGYIIPEWFGPSHKPDVPTHFFRAYFINNGHLRILNQEFFVQPIVEEVVRVHNLLVKCDESGGRFPRIGA